MTNEQEFEQWWEKTGSGLNDIESCVLKSAFLAGHAVGVSSGMKAQKEKDIETVKSTPWTGCECLNDFEDAIVEAIEKR